MTHLPSAQAAAVAEARRKEQAEREAARKAKEEAAAAAAASGEAPPAPVEEPAKKDGEDGDDDEDKGPKPVGNGDTTDRYTWTQQLAELQVVVPAEKLGVEPGQLKSKMLSIEIKKQHLKVGLKGKELLIDNELFAQAAPSAPNPSITRDSAAVTSLLLQLTCGVPAR